MSDPSVIIDVPAQRGATEPTLILAHGAGAPMDTPFMNVIAQGLAQGGVRVVRFEFDYMAMRRAPDWNGKKRPPERAPKLVAKWRSVAAAELDAGTPSDRLYIGGKSMGGRFASMVADELGVAGVVCLGYPFHPPKKPEKLRTEHLAELRTRTLIIQGERDQFGVPAEVKGYELSDQIEVKWLTDGDHSFKPRKKSGATIEGNLSDAVRGILRWLGL